MRPPAQLSACRRFTLRLAGYLVAVAVVILASHAPATARDRAQELADIDNDTVQAVFDVDRTNQYILDIEAALARAQAAHGAIPQAAAEEITRKADIRFAPSDQIARERKIVEHRMVALLNVWRQSLDASARQYVHFGATTVDIYDTALTLQLRRSTLIFIGYLRDIETILIKLAMSNQNTVMPGRTLGQHALPITFAKKVGTWLGANRRNIERLKTVLAELERAAILKGAVGTYAGLGDRAIEIEKSFANELGLKPPYPDDWHGTRDLQAQYALTLALISRSIGHIGQELFLLQMTDIGETREPRDANAASSSSLAQKVNPSKSEALIQASRAIPRLAEVVLDDVVNFFERDNTSGPNAVMMQISVNSEANLKTARRLLEQLEVDRDAMRRNLWRTQGFILAQRVAFALQPKLGKEEADKLVHVIVKKASDKGTDFRTALLADATTAGLLSANEIDTLLKPEGYLGRAQQSVEAVIAEVEKLRRTDPVK